jgi:predicted extracellular nuclease
MKTNDGFLIFSSIVMILFTMFFFGCSQASSGNSGSEGKVLQTITVAELKFNIEAGSFLYPQSVTITSSTQGSVIRYTLDGSDPTSTSGYIYTNPLDISNNLTIKAIAYKTGFADSSVHSADYQFVFKIKPLADIGDPLHPDANGTVSVYITGVYVTAVGQKGYFVQDEASSEFGGIYVYTNTLPVVSVGNKVSIKGKFAEYNGLNEITSPTLTIIDNGSILPFSAKNIAPSVLSDGSTAYQYQSMLMKVDNVTITGVFTGGSANDVYTVTGGLQVDDFLYSILTTNNYSSGKVLISIAGILYCSSNTYRLEPRSSSDFTE